MRVLICDDEIHYLDAIRGSIDRWKIISQKTDIIVDSFCSSEDMLEAINKKQIYDLAFLDVRFPGEMDGLQVARELRLLNSNIILIFISNYEEYVTDGYRVNALRYFYKPISDHQIFECMDIAYRQWQISLMDTHIVLEEKQVLYKLATRAILYIESNAPYLSIHVLSPDKSIIRIRRKIKDLYILLPSDIFVQCHQSFIVNLRYSQRVSKFSIVLTDGTQIPISTRYKNSVYRQFKGIYLGKTK